MPLMSIKVRSRIQKSKTMLICIIDNEIKLRKIINLPLTLR